GAGRAAGRPPLRAGPARPVRPRPRALPRGGGGRPARDGGRPDRRGSAVTVVRIGTRRSPLALAQAGAVAAALSARGCQPTLVEVTTHGDVSGASLAQIGGTGVFVSALREALVAGEGRPPRH